MRIPPRRLLLLLTLLGLGLLALLWHIMAPGIGWGAGGLVLTNGQDFLNYWGAPQIAQYDIHLLFAGRGYERALHQLYAQEFAELRWSYPLHSLFFFAPFATLPYGQALLLWSLLGLALYVALLWQTLPAGIRQNLVLAALVSPMVLVELLTRQNGFFIGGAALAVLWLLEKQRPILAGIILGCLTIKPQLFILWPLMLLLNREWRCLVAASLTTVALLALSLSVHGLAAWQQWWAVVPELQWRIISAAEFNETRKLTHLMMPGVLPALRILAAPEWLAQGLQWLVSGLVLLASGWAFLRPLTFAQRVLLLGSGGLLISPYAFNYDMTLLVAGLLLFWATRPTLGLYEALLSGLAYLLPLLVYVFNVTDAPLAPIILLLVFCANLRDVRAHSTPAHAGML